MCEIYLYMHTEACVPTYVTIYKHVCMHTYLCMYVCSHTLIATYSKFRLRIQI